MNVYWASRHYESLVAVERVHGREGIARTPLFLLAAHRRAVRDLAERGRGDDHVRQVARRTMRREHAAVPADPDSSPPAGTDQEEPWNDAS
jgi:hypothetical protein